MYKTLGVFENDINSYLDKLNEYININKTLNPSIEIEEVNKLIANFKIKILENRVEMASLNKNSTKYSMLKEKNHLLSIELNNLISPSKDFKGNLYPISYKDFVKMNKDYENIRRNLDMNVEIYKQLRTSIENLKIKLISENLFFSIVDTAIPSYKPINGSSLNVILKGL